jgi:hypothetical protein
MFDFTDPHTLTRDYNNSFSGRGRNSKWRIHREILAITIYGFPMEQALPAAMIVGTLVDPWQHC